MLVCLFHFVANNKEIYFHSRYESVCVSDALHSFHITRSIHSTSGNQLRREFALDDSWLKFFPATVVYLRLANFSPVNLIRSQKFSVSFFSFPAVGEARVMKLTEAYFETNNDEEAETLFSMINFHKEIHSLEDI